MVEIIEWNRNETIRVNNTFTDIDDAVYDPDTIQLKIYEPDGTVIKTVTYGAAEIIKSDVGIYYYDYSIPADAVYGFWLTVWTAVSGTINDVSRDQFKVGSSEEKLYCTYNEVLNRAGLDETIITRNEIIPFIKNSMAEIDSIMGKSFQYAQTKTEWFDTNRDDPNVRISSVYLNYTPIITVTSVEEYDTDNELVNTFEADEYWLNEATGRLLLLDDEFCKQHHRVKVVYTYGAEMIPRNISALCATMGAMQVLEAQVGGLFDDPTSFSTCGLSVSVGEPYVGQNTLIANLIKDRDKLLSNLGRMRPSCFIL